MKTVKSIRNKFKIEINFIIYEKNDDGVLLICTVHGSNKFYKTNISVDFNELDEIVALINAEDQTALYDLISDDLLNSKSLISEINIQSRFGKSIVINEANLAA